MNHSGLAGNEFGNNEPGALGDHEPRLQANDDKGLGGNQGFRDDDEESQ
jgi:hypothetical protein